MRPRRSPRPYVQVAISFVASLFVIASLPGGRILGGGATARFGTVQNDADGFIGYSHTQTVSGQPYYTSFCPGGPCMNPVGLAYVSALNIGVLTEANSTILWAANNIQTSQAGRDAILEFLPPSGALLPARSLSCVPGIPFYPGTGDNVFVPCGGPNPSGGEIVVFNASTESVVGNVSIPSYVGGWFLFSMTYDPSDGTIYVANWTNAVLSVNLSAQRLDGVANISGVLFRPGLVDFHTIAFDPSTGSLLMPGAGGVWAVTPGSYAKRGFVTLPGETVQSIEDEPNTDQLFVSAVAFNPGGNNPRYCVYVLDASTYRMEDNISVPAEVDQILSDPLHGDAYFVNWGGVIAWNTSMQSEVGTISFDNVLPWSAIFAPPGIIWGTWQLDPLDTYYSPGYTVQLSYGTTSQATTFIGLPFPEAILVLSTVVAAGAGAVSVWIGKGLRRE